MIDLSVAISVYDKVSHVDSKETIPLDIFLENIRTGKWEDWAHKVRVVEDKAKRDELKKKAPSVTISGKFSERYDDKIEQHSGYISIDVDNVPDVNIAKATISADKYVVAAFASISGRGLCAIFRIVPKKHREAFQGISEYLFKEYKFICDPTSINVSRARFVSFDPDIYINEQAAQFTQYPEKPAKIPKKQDRVIYDKDDFQMVLNQIVSKKVNLVESYHDWLRIGFALVHKFGEGGREYFHTISQYSVKYDPDSCDKQYDACLKHKANNKEATIAMFYYYAKQAGLEVYSERTRTIAYSALHGKKAGLNEEQIAENLYKFEDITDASDIIKQVFEDGIEINDDSVIDQLELWVRQHYSLRRNEITRYIVDSETGRVLEQIDLNDIFRRIKKVIPKLTYEMIDRVIHSRGFVPSFNPLKEFFAGAPQEELRIDLKTGPHLTPKQVCELLEQHFKCVSALFKTIKTKDPDHLLYFGAKWLAGLISSIYGQHSPLMMVLTGEVQNTGKTEWWRRLLPKELKTYYAESKLDAGKDDEILMCQKWIIMDDEMGGKSKKEVKRLKELTSKQQFSLREPYGRNNVDLNRIAVLCGTTNDNEILSDPTGNRRLIPVHVYGINHKAYNQINKTELFYEIYHLYQCGLRWELDKTDIEYLGTQSIDFEETSAEAELLSKYYQPGDAVGLMANEIKSYIELKTQQRLNLRRLVQELQRQGFEKKGVRRGAQVRWVYMCDEITTQPNPEKPSEDLPEAPF